MALAPPSSKYGNAGYILGGGAAGYAHTGDQLETKVQSVAVPANALGVGGQLEIWLLWSYTNNGNTKNLRVRFGAANDLTGSAYLSANNTTTADNQAVVRIANRATNSQVAFANGTNTGTGATASALTTSAIDTTAISYVVFSVQCTSSGSDTITLESYSVKLIPAV